MIGRDLAGGDTASRFRDIDGRCKVMAHRLQFFYRRETDSDYLPIGETFDCSFLSDEACDEGWFSGAMVGICCQDLTGFGKYADFDWFTYTANPRS